MRKMHERHAQAFSRAVGLLLMLVAVGQSSVRVWRSEPLPTAFLVMTGVLLVVGLALYRRELVAWLFKTLAPYLPFLHDHEEE